MNDLYAVILDIKERTADRKNYEILFKSMYNITSTNLFRKNRLYLLRGAIEPQDAIMEIVTPLLTETNNIPCYHLLRAYEKWKPPILNHSDTLFFLHQLIFIRTDYYYASLSRKVDPLFSNAINLLNKEIIISGYNKIYFLGTPYISPENVILPGSCLIDEESFNKLIIDKSNLLPDILESMSKLNGYFPAIPFYLLASKLSIQHSENDSVSDGNSIVESISVTDALNEGFFLVISKLDKYLSKNKINQIEYSGIRDALTDIKNDLESGIEIDKYFEYLKVHLKDLERSVYLERYDNIFEYLIKLLKSETILQLNKQ